MPDTFLPSNPNRQWFSLYRATHEFVKLFQYREMCGCQQRMFSYSSIMNCNCLPSGNLLCTWYRRQLFVMINTLPTISEVFLGAANNGEKETIPSNSIKDGPSSEKASKIGPLTTTRDVSLFLIYSDLAAFQTGASNKGRRRR